MEHDDRDRRDSPDAEAADDASLTPTDPIQPGEPTPLEPARSDQPLPPDDSDAPRVPAGTDAPASEFESWAAQDAVVQAPGSSDTQVWPTEPPSAGSGEADTWPTEPPERGEAPILEPEPEPEPAQAAAWTAPQPPPPEVEAYPVPATPPAEQSAGEDIAPVVAAHAVPAAESSIGESTQCPRCGTENRPGLAFCRNCGQRLVAAGVASTVERPGTPEGTTACPRCGTHNREGVAFCQNCGANLRGPAPGYVPPAAEAEQGAEPLVHERRGAILGPVVLLIGMVGLATGYLLPFAYGTGSLAERAIGRDGYGLAFWSGYPGDAALQDQAYFGLAAPVPVLGLILLALAIAGLMRAIPGPRQALGLVIALIWSAGLIILFVVVELAGNWSGDLVGMLRVLTPAGIIFFLASLIVVIGALTRFGRS